MILIAIQGENVVLKLDMAKAYNRIFWSFILQMPRCFSFLFAHWVSLIKWLIYGPWFLVLVNEVSHKFFQSQNGL